MSEDWKPGDVAMVTLAEPGFNARRGPGPHLMVRDVSGVKDVWRLAITGIVHEESEVADARRLVVIDPEDREQVERLAGLLVAAGATLNDRGVWHNGLAAALREFANPAPPKPQEPQGLGAVVEDDKGVRWVRTYGRARTSEYECWKREDYTTRHMWSEVNAVRVLSEGVAS